MVKIQDPSHYNIMLALCGIIVTLMKLVCDYNVKSISGDEDDGNDCGDGSLGSDFGRSDGDDDPGAATGSGGGGGQHVARYVNF